jgi:hypothetical protein
MKRKEFLRNTTLMLAGFLTASKLNLITAAEKITYSVNEYKAKIISLIRDLKKDGTNLVKRIMNNKEYVFDPFTHYPYDGGIKDEETGYQLFFHAHRENEYGHFHTFAKDNDGKLVHLVLISMNEKGELIGLATVNRWVTGDKFIKADRLKKFAENFYIDPSLYKDTRVLEFVNYVFKAYAAEINELFDERDKWIHNYVNKYFREPFEDRDYEILSSKKVSLINSEE